jgi:hypothetical protein
MARMFQDITNTIYDTLLIFQCYGLGILLSKDIKKTAFYQWTYNQLTFVMTN